VEDVGKKKGEAKRLSGIAEGKESKSNLVLPLSLNLNL
jgi:hypothetical protein